MQDSNICTRCGKIRIVKKEWKETVNGSTVTYSETVCPDTECQKIVDGQISEKEKKFHALAEESNARRANIRKKINRTKSAK